MRFLRSLLVWITIVGATVFFGIPSIPAAFIPPRGDWYLLFARGWARTVLKVTGVKVSVRGLESVRPGESVVYFANHESLFDIFALLVALPGRIRFLAKSSLFHIPLIGWSMWAAGFVPVKREDRKKAAGSLEEAAEKLRGGKSIIIFPEQTRTRTGEMLPFKKGGVLLALRTGFPIVPVGIAGTFPIVKKGSFFLTPGPAAVEIGAPISLEGKSISDRDEILAHCREAIGELRSKAKNRL